MTGIKFDELDHIVNHDPATKDVWGLLQWIAEHLDLTIADASVSSSGSSSTARFTTSSSFSGVAGAAFFRLSSNSPSSLILCLWLPHTRGSSSGGWREARARDLRHRRQSLGAHVLQSSHLHRARDADPRHGGGARCASLASFSALRQWSLPRAPRAPMRLGAGPVEPVVADHSERPWSKSDEVIALCAKLVLREREGAIVWWRQNLAENQDHRTRSKDGAAGAARRCK